MTSRSGNYQLPTAVQAPPEGSNKSAFGQSKKAFVLAVFAMILGTLFFPAGVILAVASLAVLQRSKAERGSAYRVWATALALLALIISALLGLFWGRIIKIMVTTEGADTTAKLQNFARELERFLDWTRWFD